MKKIKELRQKKMYTITVPVHLSVLVEARSAKSAHAIGEEAIYTEVEEYNSMSSKAISMPVLDIAGKIKTTTYETKI